MFRNTTPEDVAYVVANMRPEDIKEWWLSSGKPAAVAIQELGEKPYVSFTLGRDNEPIVIFGATIDPQIGVATMFRFATKRWPEVVRETVKVGRRLMIPLFKESGVRRLEAHVLTESDHTWLRLFGARHLSGYGPPATNIYSIDLAA